MEKNLKLPATYRFSILYFTISIILLICGFSEWINFIFQFPKSSFVGIFVYFIISVCIVPTPIFLFVWTYKLTADENGFKISFYYGPIKFVNSVGWKEITKVTATSGLMSGLSIFHKNMKPYTPLTLGPFLLRKSLFEFFEILIMKAPQAELGMGVTEFISKYSKTSTK